jgi:hypothetical protein
MTTGDPFAEAMAPGWVHPTVQGDLGLGGGMETRFRVVLGVVVPVSGWTKEEYPRKGISQGKIREQSKYGKEPVSIMLHNVTMIKSGSPDFQFASGKSIYGKPIMKVDHVPYLCSFINNHCRFPYHYRFPYQVNVGKCGNPHNKPTIWGWPIAPS